MPNNPTDARFRAPSPSSGWAVSGGKTGGRHVGETLLIPFDAIASLGAGVLNTAIQSTVYVPYNHRVRGFSAYVASQTAVTAGTDPSADLFQHVAPPPAPVVTSAGGVAGNINTGLHQYAYTFVSAAGETTASPAAAYTTNSASDGQVNVAIALGPTGTTQRKIYRTAAAGVQLKLLTTVADNTTTTYLDNVADGSLTTNVVVANTNAATLLSTKAIFSSALVGDGSAYPATAVMTDVAAPNVYAPCVYTLRAVTGAASGALTVLKAFMEIEILPT